MRGLVLVALLAVLLGCQEPPAPGPPPAGPARAGPREEGDALAARGDYAGAVASYRAALDAEPEDVALRFALGTALSHLGRREETAREFRFVLARGRPGSTEVDAARRWLIAAGELAPEVSFAAPREDAPPAEVAARPPAAAERRGIPGTGRVKVRVPSGPGGGQVVVVVADPVRALGFDRKARPGDLVEFDVPPGSYRVTGEDPETGAAFWQAEVTVSAGKETTVNLAGR